MSATFQGNENIIFTGGIIAVPVGGPPMALGEWPAHHF
jgi:hypothetical protein